jgi:hypothetical protein
MREVSAPCMLTQQGAGCAVKYAGATGCHNRVPVCVCMCVYVCVCVCMCVYVWVSQ